MNTIQKQRTQRTRRLALLLCLLVLSLSRNDRCPACPLEVETSARVLLAEAAPLQAAAAASPTDGGRVRTEALPLIGAAEYHAAGFLGAGVKVAVIDDRYAGLAARIAEGELPANIITRRFVAGEGSLPTLLEADDAHGVACAEIIHDIAPQAQLYLIQVNSLVNTLKPVLDYLHGEGVRIVSISMSTLSPGRGDGTGRVADSLTPLYALLDEARDGKDMLLVKSAGNYAQQHYQGEFLDAERNGWHEFGRSRMGIANEALAVMLRQDTPVNITLAWDDWGDDPLHPAATYDYDLYLFDARGAEVARSAARQNGAGAPVETIAFTPHLEGRYELRVRRAETFTRTHTLQIFAIGEGANLAAYPTAERSLGAPADARSVLAVGAVNVTTGRPVAYSSQGPTADGRIKPDLSSFSYVTVASPGYGPRGFGGTSAAAPHVAGMAALLLSLPGQAGLPAAELEAQLKANARDRGAPGPDTVWGVGSAQLPPLDVSVRLLGPATSPTPKHGDPRRRFVKVTVERSDGSPLAGLEPAHFDVKIGDAAAPVLTARNVAAAYLLEIALPPLPPGNHALEVSVRDRRARAAAAITVPAEAPPLPTTPILEVTLTNATPRIGEPLLLLASLSGRLPAGVDSPGVRIIAAISRPDGEVDTLTFHDDGLHNDGIAGDGIHGGWYPRTNAPGSYPIEVRLAGDANASDGTNRLHLALAVSAGVTDTDGDGLPDAWEEASGTHSRISDAQKDLDGDGLTSLEEFFYGTDPLDWDTDGDGLSDGAEVRGYLQTSPINTDTDLGGADDGAELRRGANPHNPADDAREAAPFFLPLTLRPYIPRPRPLNHALAGGFLWLAADGGAVRWELATRTYVKFTPADGLVHDTVYAILPDGDGHVWIGTQGGVSRFDGARWRNFTTAHGLPHAAVRALALAPDGSLWAATPLGVARFDGTRWQAFTTADGLPVSDLYAITVDAKGRVWIGGRGGAAVGDGLSWRAVGGNLPGEWVTAIAADAAGKIWFGTWGAGLAIFDTVTPVAALWTWITAAEGLPDNHVRALIQDESGALWVRTLDGLSAFDGNGWTTFTADTTIERQSRYAAPISKAVHRWFGTRPLAELPAALALLMTAEQRPWFGVTQRTQTGAGAWIHYQTTDRESVATLAIDSDGRVWVATDSNLSAFDGERWAMITPFEGLAEKRIVTLEADPTSGAVWAGTDGAGALRVTPGEWTRFEVSQGLVSSFIYAIAVEPNGDVWFGSGGRLNGVSRWHPASNSWMTLTRSDVLGGSNVRAIAADAQGNVWFGTEQSVSLFDGATWATPIPSSAVHAATVDAGGALWVGTAQGLSRLEADGWRTFTPANGPDAVEVRDILITPDGRLWCATPVGVRIFDARAAEGDGWRSLTTADGLLSNDVWAIARDDAGQFWFATTEGLSRWRPASQ